MVVAMEVEGCYVDADAHGEWCGGVRGRGDGVDRRAETSVASEKKKIARSEGPKNWTFCLRSKNRWVRVD